MSRHPHRQAAGCASRAWTRRIIHGTGCTFASSAAAAMALNFVAGEAVVLAKMATTEALRRGYAAGQGAGPVRPQAGFTSRIENLPEFSDRA
jgi:hydroxymethylpyrimidine kinase/phosphomethylpyrimidine kinase/thiamine-phosphate diphosphorylase